MAGYRLQTYIKKKKESQSTKEKHQPTALRLLPESPKISTLTCANGRGLLGVSTDPSAPFQTYPSNPITSLPDGCACDPNKQNYKKKQAKPRKEIDMNKDVDGKITNLKKPYHCHSFDSYTPLFFIKEMRIKGNV